MSDTDRACALAVVKALHEKKPRGMAAKQAVMDQVMAQHPGCSENRVRSEMDSILRARR